MNEREATGRAFLRTNDKGVSEVTIARYTKHMNHPAWLYTVELLVQTNGKLIKIAEINCKDEQEFEQATEWVDYTVGRGDAE